MMTALWDKRRTRNDEMRSIPSSRVVGGHALVFAERASGIVDEPTSWWDRVIDGAAETWHEIVGRTVS